VPGLGASFGRGAATTTLQDLANSDVILIMGSNMAEAHPVGFRWPMKAKLKGGKLIHVDPRFTRTSAMADVHVQIRAGTDIAFLGGLINHILVNDLWFEDYVKAYTNADVLIDPQFLDTEDLDGLFSGFDRQDSTYNAEDGHWGYQHPPDYNPKSAFPHADLAEDGHKDAHGIHGAATDGGASTHNSPQAEATANPAGQTPRDPSLKDPNCVMMILRRHFARYTPKMVGEICGCRPEQVVAVADLLAKNSGRERTGAICYAVGWTQHSTGVQIIRAASLLQLLLGNIGRPGGGIMALRGHASIQGSTDVPTLYDLLPGYLPQPTAEKSHDLLETYSEFEGRPTGYWVNFKKFAVSLMKAWWGDAAQPENDFRFGWLPRLDEDYSMLPVFNRMSKGEIKGYFLLGQNPAAGGPNSRLMRAGLRQLDWLVVADWFETDSALFWKNDPGGPPPGDIKTEVFFIPAANSVEKEGTFTNTQRLIQWHDKALDPPGDCRSDLWFIYNLGKKLRELYKDSKLERDQPLLKLTWDYEVDVHPRLPDGTPSRIEGEPDANKVLKEINGYDLSKAKLVSGFSDLKDDGTTSCGCWIYSGIYPKDDRNRARERTIGDNPIQPEWGFAWPHNRRILYNRASADPEGRPWSERKKYLWWDKEQSKWQGDDEPDFPPDKDPAYRPQPDAKGMDAVAGNHPFIMQGDGLGCLYAAGGTKDAPIPTHYEPIEAPVRNLLYGQQDNPTVRYFEGPMNPIAHGVDARFPVVACTFRVTEQYLSGPMSRFNSWLNELMPAMFVELSPELAALHGIEHAGWLTVESARGQIEARALVTRRQKPMHINGGVVHQIGIPFHWGYAGETVGGIANDLIPLTAAPNVSMHEAKVFTCQVRAGRCTGQPTIPTVAVARWANRELVPDTPAGSQPEGHLEKEVRKGT
jgi:formate dehydrogenase major subunit